MLLIKVVTFSRDLEYYQQPTL